MYMFFFYDNTHFLTTFQFQLKLNQSFMKETHLFNKWYCNKYEQGYIIVLFIEVEIFNITVYFSTKHNFELTITNYRSAVLKIFFLMLNRNTTHQKYSYYTNYAAGKKNVHPLLNELQTLRIYSADILLTFLQSNSSLSRLLIRKITNPFCPIYVDLHIHTVSHSLLL